MLAAVLFVLGIAGLAATVRQTGSGPTSVPLTDLVVARPLAPSPSASGSTPSTPFEAVSDTVAPSPVPSAVVKRQESTFSRPESTAPPLATATAEPTADSHGGAIAAGVASDGGELVANATTTPLNPLRFGMVGRDGVDETPEATTTPEPSAISESTGTPEPTATPEPAATPTP